MVPPAAHNVTGPPAEAVPADRAVIADDLPCTGCGYNLRGLSQDGRCPECALPVADTLAAERLRQARTGPPDPRWARQIREGAWLGLGTFVLLLGALLAPDAWYHLPYRNAPLRETPGRIVFLGVACAWWVLAWASAWKLTMREQLPGHPPPRALVATAARWLVTAYALTPFVWAWVTWHHDPWWRIGYPMGLPVAILEWAGIAGGVGLFARVSQLMRRRRAWAATVEAWLLAIVVPGAVLYASGVVDAGPSSLTMMFDLPVYAYGMPVLYERFIFRSFPTHLDELVVWVYLVLPLWSAWLLLRLAWRYRGTSTAPPREPAPLAPSQP